MFENVYGRMHGLTDGRTPDRPVYYKLTLSGELKMKVLECSQHFSHYKSMENFSDTQGPLTPQSLVRFC